MPNPKGYDAYGNPIYDDNTGYGQVQNAGAGMFGLPQAAGPSMYPTVRKPVPNTGYGSTSFAAGVPMYGTQNGPNALSVLGNWWNDYNANFRGRQSADPYGAFPLPTAYQPAPFPNYPNYMGSQANPLGIQSILPTAQAGQGAMPNAQAGAGNPFAGMPNPRETGTVTPPTQKPVTEDNRGGLAANGGAGKNTNTGASAGGGTGTKSNNPNVPPNAVDSGRGDKIWTDGRGKHSDNDNVELSYRLVDDQFRQGFTDAFIQQHGEDPLSFYKRAFANDPKYAGWETSNAEAAKQLNFRAADAAINDARFLPGAIAEWQQKHGGQAIPQEQWETWWRISQSTNGYGINGGAGVSQYGVY